RASVDREERHTGEHRSGYRYNLSESVPPLHGARKPRYRPGRHRGMDRLISTSQGRSRRLPAERKSWSLFLDATYVSAGRPILLHTYSFSIGVSPPRQG